METTLTILKPDSVGAGDAGKILTLLEEKGFQLRALKMLRLTESQARSFYEVHAERPFYDELVEFMTSGLVVPAALERENAIDYLREVMGATDPRQAAEGTVRALYGTDVQANAIHGSDSPENAARELAFFFSTAELLAGR